MNIFGIREYTHESEEYIETSVRPLAENCLKLKIRFLLGDRQNHLLNANKFGQNMSNLKNFIYCLFSRNNRISLFLFYMLGIGNLPYLDIM